MIWMALEGGYPSLDILKVERDIASNFEIFLRETHLKMLFLKKSFWCLVEHPLVSVMGVVIPMGEVCLGIW